MKLTNLIKIIFTLALSFTIAGCGDDDSNAGTPTAPSGISSGTTLTINPTVTLNGGPTNGTFTYDNLAGDLAEFPTSTSQETGNWAFTRDSDTAFTLVLTFTDTTLTPNSLTITFNNFLGTATSITEMRASVQGGSSDISVSVTGTALASAAPANTGGGNNGGGTDIPPASALGQNYDMVLDFLSGNEPSEFPYALNDTENFTMSSSGAMFRGPQQVDLGLPVNVSGSEYLYEDSAQGLYFGFSVPNGALNEINIYGSPSGPPFYGQFVVAGGGDNGGGDNGGGDGDNGGGSSTVAGTYSVTYSVVAGPPENTTVDPRVGILFSTSSSTFTIVDAGGDGTPDSIRLANGTAIPLTNSDVVTWVFKLDLDNNPAHSVTVQAPRNQTTGEVDALAVTYNNMNISTIPPVVTFINWTSGTSVTKQP